MKHYKTRQRGKIKIKVNIAHEEKKGRKRKIKSQTLHSQKKKGGNKTMR
jgi:hypothetical protein